MQELWKKIKEGYLEEQTRLYDGNDLKHAKSIDYKSFGIIKKRPGSFKLKLIVVKGDLATVQYKDQFKLQIAISWYK